MPTNADPCDYTRVDERGVTIIRLHRQVSIDRFVEIVQTLVDEGVSSRRLWNLGSYFDFTAPELRGIAAMGKSLPPYRGVSAYVASEDLHFGLVRMFEALREQEGYQTRAFRNEEEAMEWLSLVDR